jgi:starvation-inducible DNA-binding protein
MTQTTVRDMREDKMSEPHMQDGHHLESQPRPEREHATSKELAWAIFGVLSDCYVLRLKTEQVHWNIEGPLFETVHGMTEASYKKLSKQIDELAERVRSLRFYVPARFTTFEEHSILSFGQEATSAHDMVKELVSDYEQLSRRIRQVIAICDEKGDPVTEDLLVGILTDFDESSWQFVSLLDGKSEFLR